MKSLILVGNLNSPHILKIVRSLSSDFHEICLCSIESPDIMNRPSYSKNITCNLSFRIFPLHWLPLPGPLKYLIAGLWARRFLQSYSIVNSHYASGYGLMTLFASWPRSYFVSVWGSDITDFPFKSIIHKFIMYLVLHNSIAVLVTSIFLKDKLLQLYPLLFKEKAIFHTPFCIPSPFFESRFLEHIQNKDKSNKSVVFGLAKELKEIYNVSLLLHVFADLIAMNNVQTQQDSSCLRLELRIAGGGSSLSRYIDLARSLGIDQYVTFLGPLPVDEMPNFYKSIDVYMAISKYESFGVSALEASASGVPSISSGVGGLSEVVIDGKTGIVVHDISACSLKNAMLLLISDHQLRARLGFEAFRLAKEKYNIEAMREAFNTAYSFIDNGC